MNDVIIVTGTDTDIGKTVFAAGLTRFLDGMYWKPVQAGTEGGTDSQTVLALSGLPRTRIVPEAYRLALPASPHLSAEQEGVQIDVAALALPRTDRTLIVEGAGGLMVPLSRSQLYIDQFARWQAPVVLCARTGLGTLNHTLLSLEALRRRRIQILGVALLGTEHRDNERTIAALGNVPVLGRLPIIDPLNAATLAAAFAVAFAASWKNRDGRSAVS